MCIKSNRKNSIKRRRMYAKCVNDVSYIIDFMGKHWFKYDIFV